MTDPLPMLTVPRASLRVYEAAARLLRRKLGTAAPSTMELIRYELSHRHARMIADDYLETHPQISGSPVRRAATRPGRSAPPRSFTRRRGKWQDLPDDPSLN